MKIHKAGLNDIEDLVQLRIDYLIMDKGELSPEEERQIRSQLKLYFAKHILSDDFIALLAKEDNKILAGAFLVIQEKPANPSFVTGITATLMNVVTYPEYRKKGIATKLLQSMIEQAKAAGVSSIDLSSTEDGKELYRKLGFSTPNYTSMWLKL